VITDHPLGGSDLTRSGELEPSYESQLLWRGRSRSCAQSIVYIREHEIGFGRSEMGQEKKKSEFSNEKISSFDVTSVRLEKGSPARTDKHRSGERRPASEGAF
jgi:hypothetical protein